MANIVKQLGSPLAGAGAGLAEQLPKEIDRYRLSQGLQNLAQNAPNQSALQNYLQAASIYGISPQTLQGLPDVLKQEGSRNFIKNYKPASGSASASQAENETPETQFKSKLDVGFGRNEPNRISPKGEERPSDFVNEEAKATADRTLPGRNPLSAELIPKKPWTQDKKLSEMAAMQEQNPQATFDDLSRLADEKEARELAQPEAEQKIDSYFEDKKKKADSEFDRQLSVKLQKTGADTYADLPGEMQLSLKRGMINDLISNKNLNEESAANKWSEIGLNNAKALKELETLSHHSYFEKPSTILQKLKTIQKPFAKAGNKESYEKYLTSTFDFSPQRSAQIAYPYTDKISNFIDSTKRTRGYIPGEMDRESRKRAIEVQKLITSEDSILAIARGIKDKDPYFDEKSFFDQIRENIDALPFTPKQILDMGIAESSPIPKWADLWYFPWPSAFSTVPLPPELKEEKK